VNSGTTCYHSVQNILSYRLLSKYIKIKIYKTIPVLFNGCETWSLTLTVEHRKTVFEKRVLRRTFRPTREGVRGDWRRLHKEEFHDLRSFFSMTQQPLVGQGLLTVEASRSHSVTYTTFGSTPWMSDQPDEETSTWQHRTLTRDSHPCSRRDSSPQSQQWASADPRFRPRGYWDRRPVFLINYYSGHKIKKDVMRGAYDE
jgi:hypothetical protein